jgi:hypothetical protein
LFLAVPLNLTVRSFSQTTVCALHITAGRLMDAAFEQGMTMLQKSILAVSLILTSLLLSACNGPHTEPPLLAKCGSLECSAQQAWRTS